MSEKKNALLISCFADWYKDRLKPVEEYLIDNDYSVTCIVSDYNHIKKNREEKTEDCLYVHVPRYKKNISILRIYSHLKFGKEIKKYLRDRRPTLIYLIVPPNNTAAYCRRYKKNNPQTHLIVDIIDLWPESMPLGRVKNTLPARIWRSFRDDALQISDFVFTECNLYQEKLKGVINHNKTETLYLFKERSEEELILINEIINQQKTDGVIRFAYLGSMNNIIDIEGICSVIKSFMESGKECEFHAIGDGETRQKFEEAVKNTGCHSVFYGVIFDEIKKINILAPCDYAFNMMKDDVSVGLTIKSIDYLSYGLPLINNIKGDTAYFVKRENIGVNYTEGQNVDYSAVSSHRKIHEFYLNNFTKKAFVERLRSCVENLLT